jgi:hypothetical protein
VNPSRAGSMGRAASKQIGKQMLALNLRAEARNYGEVAHVDEDDVVWSEAWLRLSRAALFYVAGLSPKERAALAKAEGK